MNGWPRLWTAVAALIAALIAVLIAAACDASLVIERAVAVPAPACVADANGPSVPRTHVDLEEATSGAWAALVVDAAPPQSFAGFTSAFVWFTSGPAGLPSDRESARVQGLQGVTGPERPLPDGVNELAFVQLLTAEERALLLAMPIAEPTTLEALEALEANIVVEAGRRDGDATMTSAPYSLPIDLCRGCLRRACVDAPGCVPGQDDPVGPPCR